MVEREALEAEVELKAAMEAPVAMVAGMAEREEQAGPAAEVAVTLVE